SFGSRVALKLGCRLPEPRPVRLIAAGFPTTLGKFDYLSGCGLPKYFVHSTNDVHGPRAQLEQAFAHFAEPKNLEFIEAGDHFFAGSLDKLETAIAALPRGA
ncbi:MAG: hypothetical protein ABUS49_03475, partial [Acidobacteriota bacterium]